jgi:hypothetical protein
LLCVSKNKSLNLNHEFHFNTIDNIIPNLNKAKINSTDSIFVYKKFLKTSNLIITEADKNIGLVRIDKNIYNTLCYEHLNDITYKIIEDFN